MAWVTELVMGNRVGYSDLKNFLGSPKFLDIRFRSGEDAKGNLKKRKTGISFLDSNGDFPIKIYSITKCQLVLFNFEINMRSCVS